MTCKLNWPRTDSKQRASLQHSGRRYGLHCVGRRRRECGHTAAGKAGRVLGCSRHGARLECSVQGVRWRSGATSAEADGGGCESGSTDPKHHDPGGRRPGSVGTALVDGALVCKGAALNVVILAGGGEGLEAWRQLTEKYEPKMTGRFAGQLMSILSFSLQGDTAERITAWEREMAT